MMIDNILEEIKQEYLRSNKKFKDFNSTHEGYAVIKEELEELWDEIKLNKDVYTANLRMKSEAIQVAAMALKFILSLLK